MMRLRLILRDPRPAPKPPFAMDVPRVRPTDIPASNAERSSAAYIVQGGRAIPAPWMVFVRHVFDESFRAVRARLRQSYERAYAALPMLAQGHISTQTLAAIMVDRTLTLFGLPSRASNTRPQPQLAAA